MEICSRSGTVMLLNKDMNVISTRNYFTRRERERIIIGWEKIYGRVAMLRMAIQINPTIDKSKDDKTISKIKRMAAGQYGRYDNKKKYQEQITKSICQQLKLNTFELITYDQYRLKSLI